MQNVSPQFNPYSDQRHCGLRVAFELADTGAAEQAAVVCSSECEISQLGQVHDRVASMAGKYATLEKDHWFLDGSFEMIPRNIASVQLGWWTGGISNAQGEFSSPEVLEFTFPHNSSSVGFTVCFDELAGEYATSFAVTTYDMDGKVIEKRTVENDSSRCILNMPTENYRGVKLEFFKTNNPFRRLRVSEVIFGVIQYFEPNNVTSAGLTYELSPNSLNLPTSELTITFDNSDHSYNMVNPKGVYGYLQQAQPLDVVLTVEDETVNMGRFYFVSAEAEDGGLTAKITARDKIHWLDKSVYRHGGNGTWSFGEAVADIIKTSRVYFPVRMTQELSERNVSKAVPECTYREALRLFTQAARCACYVSREGELAFVDLELGEPVDVLNQDTMSEMPKTIVSEKINVVELKVRNEYAEPGTEEGIEVIYRAEDIGVDEMECVVTYENPVVVEGRAVAEWLLNMHQKRLTYSIAERGNPAREIGDIAVIEDLFGENRPAIITKEQFSFNGGISCSTEACGGGDR